MGDQSDGKEGNLIHLGVSSLMSWHGFRGSERSWGTESLQTLGQGGFRLLEESYVRGASMECMFSVGIAGIPCDRTWALFSYGAKGGGDLGGRCVEVMMCEIILPRCIYTCSHNCKRRESHYMRQQTSLYMCTQVHMAYIILCVCTRLLVHISRHACVLFPWQCDGAWSPFTVGWLWVQTVSQKR